MNIKHHGIVHRAIEHLLIEGKFVYACGIVHFGDDAVGTYEVATCLECIAATDVEGYDALKDRY